MKIVVVGESIVTGDKLAKAAESLVFRNSVVVKRIEWHTGETLNIEKNGPESESYPPQLPDEIRDADVLLIHFCPIPREVISKAKNLKLIGICRGGTENIDVEAAAERDIPVIHVIRNAEPVAEFTVGMILSETRNLARSYLAIKNGIWRKDFSNSGTLNNKGQENRHYWSRTHRKTGCQKAFRL
jgi:D-3-phosphoglycerate dehydrogenase